MISCTFCLKDLHSIRADKHNIAISKYVFQNTSSLSKEVFNEYE